MATLDTLEPQSRAIIELLLRQRQGYDDIAATLDMPPARVRELAREALTALAPGSAGRVDGEWRDQIADYVLHQQTGPEIRATRGHLKRSEPARAWVSSLVDSLDPLYGDGDRPDVPEPDGGGAGASRAGRAGAGTPSGRATAAAVGAGAGLVAGSAGASSEPETAERESGRAEETDAADAPAPDAQERSQPSAPRGGSLSPEAHQIVRRRRIVGGALAAAALLAAIVLAIVLLSGDGEDERAREPNPRGGTAQNAAAGQARLVGQAPMRRIGRGRAQGIAVIAERGGRFQLLVQARGLEPSGRRAAYEVWLYNSPSDATSLGGQVTDDRGNLQGAGPLPPNFRDYRNIDVSRERIDRNPRHSGTSVLRVPLADVLRGGGGAAAGGGGGAGGAGGTGAPQP